MALAQTPSSRNKANLVRLLRSCESLSASLSVSAPAQSRADRRRFETYLTVLQRQWQELASDACVSEMLLSEYRRKIERLAELLDADKMVTGSGAALARTQAHCNGSLTREQANTEIVNRLQTTTCMQEAALNARAPFNAAFGRRGLGARAGSRGVDAEALQSSLSEQRELHDTLLADLADSVGQLRDRSLQARSAVRDDLRTLDSTSDQLDGNRAKLDENNTRLRIATNAMRSSTCMICLMLAVVCMLFVGTFLMMKVVPKRPRAPVVQTAVPPAL